MLDVFSLAHLDAGIVPGNKPKRVERGVAPAIEFHEPRHQASQFFSRSFGTHLLKFGEEFKVTVTHGLPETATADKVQNNVENEKRRTGDV